MFTLKAEIRNRNQDVILESFDNEYFTLELVKEQLHVTANITAKKNFVFKNLVLTTEKEMDTDRLFFVNGYQTWTTSLEMDRNGKMPGLMNSFLKNERLLKRFGAMGDYSWSDDYGKKGCFHSYTFTYFRTKGSDFIEFYGSKTERNGFTIFQVDMNEGLFSIRKDLDGMEMKKGEEAQVIRVVKIMDTYENAFDSYFFKYLKLEKPTAPEINGYTTWYNYFGKVTEEDLLRDLASLDAVNEQVNIVQLDDGYQSYTGEWLKLDKKKFKSGMKPIVSAIHDKGYKAGLWLAPFSVERKSSLVRKHPAWFIREPGTGKMVFGGYNWGGSYVLDIYHPEVRRYLKKVFDTVFNEWGFDLVKLDFLYMIAIYPRNGKTRGELMADGVDLLRELCGDKLILGCGVPLGSCFGKFDYCRIGCDANPDFKGNRFNKMHIHNELPSAENAILSSLYRRGLHGRAFINDPDVFFLRDENLDYTEEQKLLLAKVNELSGGIKFISDDVSTYSEKELEYLKSVFSERDTKINMVESYGSSTVVYFTENGENRILRFNRKTGKGNVEAVF